MRLAQSLYEAGAITYMRTDGVQMDGGAIASLRDAIGERYDSSYLPEKPRYTMPRWNGGVLLAHDGISLEELKTPAKGLRPPDQVVETLKTMQAILEDRSEFGFEISSLDDVDEFQPPVDFQCQLKN